MATTKPRITITLEKAQYELVRRMAKAQGQSMSSIVVETVEMIAPTMENVLVMLDSLANVREDVRQGLKQSAQRAEDIVTPLLGQALEQIDLFKKQISEAERQVPPTAVTAPASPRIARKSPKNPRPVITGVRSLNKAETAKPKRRKNGQI